MNRVDRRGNRRDLERDVVGVNPVDKERHRRVPRSSHVDAAVDALARQSRAGAGWRCTRNQARQLQIVTSVERQVDDLLVRDHVADLGGILFEQQQGRCHLDPLDDLADLQRQVYPCGLIHVEFDLFDHPGLK